MDDVRELADIFLEAARLASGRIMAIYQTDFTVESKSDQSPVTEADLAAETAILNHLSENNVLIPIVSEESVAAGIIPDIDQSYILVDPLDGTREFVNRNGEFTVNIALVVDGEPVLGVVFAPVLNEAFWGMKGEGAYRAPIEASAKEIVSAATPIEVARPADGSGLKAVASRSHLSPETEAFLSANPIADIVSFGSSLKLCRLAQGMADVYPRLSPTNQWDIAAGDAVLRAAGGNTITPRGETFQYRAPRPLRASGFLNSWFVAHGGFDPARLVL